MNEDLIDKAISNAKLTGLVFVQTCNFFYSSGASPVTDQDYDNLVSCVNQLLDLPRGTPLSMNLNISDFANFESEEIWEDHGLFDGKVLKLSDGKLENIKILSSFDYEKAIKKFMNDFCECFTTNPTTSSPSMAISNIEVNGQLFVKDPHALCELFHNIKKTLDI